MATRKAKTPTAADWNKHEEEPTTKSTGKKKGPSIALAKRQVRVTNLNFSPERNGEEKVARVDLSIEVLLEPEDIAQFLITDREPNLVDKGVIASIWDNGVPMFSGMTSMVLLTKVVGFSRLGLVTAKAKDMVEFENTVLKKCRLELMLNEKAKLIAQIRVEPTGRLELLENLVIREEAQFSFNGDVQNPDGNDAQGQLLV